MLKRFFAVFITAFFLAAPAFALSFHAKNDHVSITVTPQYKALSDTDGTLSLITAAEISRGWHLYWDNPGDVGDPTTLSFTDSPHYTPFLSLHSAPEKNVYEDIITSYVYSKTFFFKTTFRLQNLKGVNRLPFGLTLSYTACRESCLPETLSLSFALPLSAKSEKNPAYLPADIAAENSFPIPLQADASLKETLLTLKLENHILKNCSEPEFVSRHPKANALADLPETTVLKDNSLSIAFKGDSLPPDFKGILLCPGHSYYVDPLLPQPKTLPAAMAQAPSLKTAADTPPLSPTPEKTAFYYLITAFIAGLILNLMPCVLPVLGLKALYLVNHRQSASPASALAYLAGVLCSFLVLSGLLFALRGSGSELGWGFQLQSPVFNIILFVIFLSVFLNLTDRLPLPDKCADRLSRLAANSGFLTGFFAVIVACPCTGPFMGAALGYALSQSAPVYFGIFLSLGLGYALPYTLVEFFPTVLIKILPRPGRWMLTLKKILALPILATCLWLGWIIFHQLYQTSVSSTSSLWHPYSPAAVAQARQKGQSVFINFTAKWCLVCLLNDKTTFNTKSFQNHIKNQNIQLFKADWTNKDNNITEALQSYGRTGVPLYIYYPQTSAAPRILPQILSPALVTKELN